MKGIALIPIACAIFGAGCKSSRGGERAAPERSGYRLGVSPVQLAARQHVGGPREAPLVYSFSVPARLQGGGLPADLTSGSADLAVAQIELPQGMTDEKNRSYGVALFDPPQFCRVGAVCPASTRDGFWRATVLAPDGKRREVQLAMAMRDVLYDQVYQPAFGVFLPPGDALEPGDRLELRFIGKVTARATDWTDRPFLAHFRYRSFLDGRAGPWTVLADAEVQPLQIGADAQPKFVRALAPLDVAAGVPFSVAVVVTDRYGNPKAITGIVRLSGGVDADVQFKDEWRKELADVVYSMPGFYKIVPQLAGARAIHHYTRAWPGAPPLRRRVGDLHSHTGDGGAQRKFLGAFAAGDHTGLYARTRDALRYMREVAGLDFGAVSEHAVRWDRYAPPAALRTDPSFAPGGPCAGAGRPIAGLDDWFTRQQRMTQAFDDEANGAFVVFPAFEWHAQHTRPHDRSPLHRVVLFRDFSPDPARPLPILPGDVRNLAPQCVVRFLAATGFGPDQVMVVPHLTEADDTNIDWALTYADTALAPRAQTDRYYRVGEIYSARAIDQLRAAGTATLTVFEGDDGAPGRWSFRYGWRELSAHIGVIGASDNHQQMPGVNDDLDLDGLSYQANEPGGYAVVLAATADRGGVYDALVAQRTYATSGIRAWFEFSIDGAPVGAALRRTSVEVPATIALMSGSPITRVELWGVPVGVPGARYERIRLDAPNAETYQATAALANPLGAPGTAEWLYYVRAFFKSAGSPNDADEALWSSPIWITWSKRR